MSARKIQLIPAAERLLAVQSYTAPKVIDGVKIVELRRFTAEDGAFAEVVHAEKGVLTKPEELKGFEIKQMNHSLAVPGTVKAWHLHFEQDEIWFVHPEAALILGLLDVRKNSKTAEKTMRLCLGRGKAQLVFIPRGVAHGLSNPFGEPAAMTYLVNNHFNGSDERRLPADFGVRADFWQLAKG